MDSDDAIVLIRREVVLAAPAGKAGGEHAGARLHAHADQSVLIQRVGDRQRGSPGEEHVVLAVAPDH